MDQELIMNEEQVINCDYDYESDDDESVNVNDPETLT
jgi:hypothetical protein